MAAAVQMKENSQMCRKENVIDLLNTLKIFLKS